MDYALIPYWPDLLAAEAVAAVVGAAVDADAVDTVVVDAAAAVDDAVAAVGVVAAFAAEALDQSVSEEDPSVPGASWGSRSARSYKHPAVAATSPAPGTSWQLGEMILVGSCMFLYPVHTASSYPPSYVAGWSSHSYA